VVTHIVNDCGGSGVTEADLWKARFSQRGLAEDPRSQVLPLPPQHGDARLARLELRDLIG